MVSLLATCTNLLMIRHGKSIHLHILANGIELHVALGTALLNILTILNCTLLWSWTATISSLTETGDREESISLFTRMEETGLRLDDKSFSAILCMVDLYGSTGKIEEVVSDYYRMPMEPNSVILGSYLSSCKQHGLKQLPSSGQNKDQPWRKLYICSQCVIPVWIL
ncbi:pentatricopeptide repeat-containing protein At5g59600-like [Olea europaea var. sylvestris]|uniref:pentatricopeptide repeat-containing protein At5g59600-like n=1 Tax=Olea europaea var. sylvestris TaxID=158386 RepID=UPI000C1CD494|nr:pentatricopeptide repeat-containing protein At5g59600-like [Olea europaea var. sylvestris]